MQQGSKDFTEVFSRLGEIGIGTQKKLAQVLEISPPAISDAKQRGTFPKGWAVKLSAIYGRSVEWILTGRSIKPAQEEEETRPSSALEKTACDIEKKLGFEYCLAIQNMAGNVNIKDKYILMLEENIELRKRIELLEARLSE